MKLRPGRAIVDATVRQAQRELLPAPATPAVLVEPDDQDDDEDGALVEEDMLAADWLAELRQLGSDLSTS